EHEDNLNGWKLWYDQEREDGKLKFRTREKFKDEFADADLEGHSFVRTKPRATDLELLVLPNLGKSDEYWYPSIFELNKTFKCTFIQLPDCSRMKNLKYMKDRTGQVNRTAFEYPLEQLVDVFEKRREKFEQKKVGLIAHGVSGWVALEYLRLHPDKIAFAIIINTWSGKQSREAGRNQMAGFKGKDEAYKHHAEDLIYDPNGRVGSLSLNDEEKMWSQTGSIRRQGGDLKALEPIFYGVFQQYRVKQESNQRILVPDYEFTQMNKRKKIDTPVLFIHGGMDPMFVEKDQKDYAKTFTKMQWEVFEDAGCTPWADDPQRFFDSVNTLMDKYKIVEELKKEAEKERKKREKEEKKNK
ncbi:alpha/beta hydrolase, partial [Planctomycetota bacterium]|nr:alpha/beta hydrolase [Planctomycetota bacterium]